MTQEIPKSAAQSIFPNLPSDKPVTPSWAGRERTESVGAALYPNLVVKPKSAEQKYFERLKGKR
jgi:hypothetical protein